MFYSTWSSITAADQDTLKAGLLILAAEEMELNEVYLGGLYRNGIIQGTNIKCANSPCRGMYDKPKHSRKSCPAEWFKCLICKIELYNLCQEVNKTGHDVIQTDRIIHRCYMYVIE